MAPPRHGPQTISDSDTLAIYCPTLFVEIATIAGTMPWGIFGARESPNPQSSFDPRVRLSMSGVG
jgi:hypothetical protein